MLCHSDPCGDGNACGEAMRCLTYEQKRASTELIKPFLSAVGKNGSIANAARITGISQRVLSKWVSGGQWLIESYHPAILAYIACPPVCSRKYQDAGR